MNGKRSIELDIAKGFAILLMVIGHAIAWNYPDRSFLTGDMASMSQGEQWGALLWRLIYSFHMPLFFFISGYLMFKSDTDLKWLFSSVKKKLTRILLPYISTALLLFFYNGSSGYWFLQILFIVSITGAFITCINCKAVSLFKRVNSQKLGGGILCSLTFSYFPFMRYT